MSLRSRASHFNSDFDDQTGTSSMRMPCTNVPPRVTYPTMHHRGATTGAPVVRRRNVNSNFQKRRKVITSIKRKAKEFRQKIPSVKDVNKIDKYSRLVFPSLFIVFNICYWCFYLLQWRNRISGFVFCQQWRHFLFPAGSDVLPAYPTHHTYLVVSHSYLILQLYLYVDIDNMDKWKVVFNWTPGSMFYTCV